MTRKEVCPGTKSGATTNQTAAATTTEADSFSHCRAVSRRRSAARRSEPLACGCRDPWCCRCFEVEPTEKSVDGYAAAVDHLNSCGLAAAPNIAAMRVMWRRGGDDRRLVRDVASRWEVSA